MKRADAIRGIVTAAAAAVLLAHLFAPGRVKVDAIALVLLAVAILPWLGDVFESIDFPGGGGVKFRETVKAAGELVAASAPRVEGAPNASGKAPSPRHEPPRPPDEWRAVLPSSADPNLQLVALRVEIEKRLAALVERSGAKARSLNDMLRAAQERSLVEPHVIDALRTLIAAGNMAAHGRPIDRELGEWVRETGPDILRALDMHLDAIGT